jgi:membrane protein implicated in regulation of membrane protease activity
VAFCVSAIRNQFQTVNLMILLMVAAWIGGAVTVAALWPFGALTALLSAPFGGSLLALVAGLSLAILRTGAERKQKRGIASFRTRQKEAA